MRFRTFFFSFFFEGSALATLVCAYNDTTFEVFHHYDRSLIRDNSNVVTTYLNN